MFGTLAIGAGWLIIGGTGVEALARNSFRQSAEASVLSSSRLFWAKPALVSLLLTIVGLSLLYGPILPRIVATPEAEKDWPSQIEVLFVEKGLNTEAVEDYLKVFRLYGPMGKPRSWLVWSFVLLAAFGTTVVLARQGTRRTGVYILVWIFVPILGAIIGLQFMSGFYVYRRFFIFFQPLYLLLMAYGMLSFGRSVGWLLESALPKMSGRILENGVIWLLILVSLGAAAWKLNDQMPEDLDNRWRLAAQTILANGENPTVICEAYNDRMREGAAHRDECYRNLEFYLTANLEETSTWLHREVDQFA